MPGLDLPEDMLQRLSALAKARGVTSSQYASDLLREMLRLPDPADWLSRLRAAAYQECRAMLATAGNGIASEEFTPAFLPLAVVPSQVYLFVASELPATGRAEQRPVEEDSLAIALELLAGFYLDICAQDPARPQTREIATLETCLAERYFYCVSFAELRSGLFLAPQDLP